MCASSSSVYGDSETLPKREGEEGRPLSYAAVIPRLFKACLRGESPVIYVDGEQTRDFTFVADAVRANLLAASAPASACSATYKGLERARDYYATANETVLAGEQAQEAAS